MRHLSLHVLVVAACTGASSPAVKSEPTKAESTKAEPTKAEPTKAEPAAPKVHACVTDTDCIASCRHGAVSRAWHTKVYPGGEACEDGCTSKGTDAPRCESSECVAYRQGARDPVCTGVDVEPIVGHGPAHRCSADDQCVTTCDHGAVNKEWLSWQKPSECGGGCGSPAQDPTKCEDGRCVAYRGGRPDPGCTGRPVPR